MKIRLFVGYSVITTMVLNLNAALIGFAISGLAIAPAPAYALFLSDTPKQDEMNAKYNLSNPTRNHQTDTFNPKLEAYFSQPARDLNPTLGKVLSTPVPTRTIDLSGHNLNRTMDEQLDMAKNLSKTHGTPVKNAGDYKSEYTKSGTREFKRDANGNLVMGVVEGVPKVSNFSDDDLLGTEAQNPNYTAEQNKESMYGDDTKIFAEGKAIHTNFKDANAGKSASGRAYRAITRSAQQGIDTNIPENEPWLQPSFNAVKDAQNPATMFGSCQDIKKPVIDKISVPKTTEHKCQDITQINKDFCEVTRKINIPVYSNSPGLRSCGVGCYEFELNIDVWKTSKCRSSPGDVAPAKFTLNLNLGHGIAIKNVHLTGTADDHFLYQLNGQKLWESNGGSQSTSGDINAGSCNSSGSAHSINTNLTSTVKSIVGPLGNSGVYSLTFQADIRWKRNGGIRSTVRFEVEDLSGEGLETKFIQNPVGCYDALLPEVKLQKGLTGIYDKKQIGIDPSTPDQKFTCSRTPDTPTCSAGENLFGSVTKERCLSIPVWPELNVADSPYRPGMFVHKPPTCPVGTLSADGNTCSYPVTKSCPTLDSTQCGVNEQTYAPTKVCPPLSSTQCGVDAQNKPIMTGTLNGALTGEMCVYTSGACPAGWSVEGSPTISCPSGGSLSNGLCLKSTPIMSGPLQGAISGEKCLYSSGACPSDWKIENDVTLTCPDGGTVVDGVCQLPSTKHDACSPNATLNDFTVLGQQDTYCNRAPDKKSNPWSCSSNSFSAAHCNVTPENYLDGNSTLIKTVTDDGFPINPVVDEEGAPVVFSDFANCTISGGVNDPNNPPPKSFCNFESYQSVEVSDKGYPSDVLSQIPPFFDGDTGNKTWKVNLKKYRCDPSLDQIRCRINDETGEKECVTWEEMQKKPDQCAVYKQDPTCKEISSTCPDGWLEPITNRCMSETKRYECTTSSTIDVNSEVTTNTCTGMLPCIGGDCEVTEPETNPNFVKAMVAASVIDEAQDDSKCEDPSDPLSCRIFNGEFKYCSWETTGLGVDCCEEAKGVDIVGFVVFSRQMMKVGKMAGSGVYGNGVQGMYKTLSTPITNATEAISSWSNTAVNEVGSFVQGAYSSTVNSLMGSTEVVSTTGNAAASIASTGAGEGMTAAMEAAMKALQQEVYSFVYNMLPESLANLIFTTSTSATGATTYTANGPLTNALSNVMAVYAAYQMIKLALTLLTACDDIEMDMGVKIAQRTCFKIGDTYCAKKYPLIGSCMQERQNYCCYSSILSRIVMKESYSQLGIDPLPFGNKPSKGPEMEGSCQGLTFEQFGQVNFDSPSMQTALQEWVGLLLESKQIPSETSEQSLTGGASTDASNCPPVQKPIMECYTDAQTLKEVCEHKRDLSGKLMYDLVPQECIKNIKPGQIWNAAGRKVSSERTIDNIGTAQDRVQESKNKMRDAANSLDCSSLPRPPVCSYQIDPRDN